MIGWVNRYKVERIRRLIDQQILLRTQPANDVRAAATVYRRNERCAASCVSRTSSTSRRSYRN